MTKNAIIQKLQDIIDMHEDCDGEGWCTLISDLQDLIKELRDE